MSQSPPNNPQELLDSTESGQFFDPAFARHLENKVRGELPQEKAEAKRRQQAIARDLQAEGSVINGSMGQKLGSIDARVYYRLRKEFPEDSKDPAFWKSIFADSPDCKSPGWIAKPCIGRKGVVYVNGVPITPHKGLAQ